MRSWMIFGVALLLFPSTSACSLLSKPGTAPERSFEDSLAALETGEALTFGTDVFWRMARDGQVTALEPDHFAKVSKETAEHAALLDGMDPSDEKYESLCANLLFNRSRLVIWNLTKLDENIALLYNTLRKEGMATNENLRRYIAANQVGKRRQLEVLQAMSRELKERGCTIADWRFKTGTYSLFVSPSSRYWWPERIDIEHECGLPALADALTDPNAGGE